jgi:chromobox protein 1
MNAQGEPLFEVKWEGYSKPEDRTWEPEDNLLYEARTVTKLVLSEC